MQPKTVEHFLSAKVARHYSVKNHNLGRLMPEIYAASASLYRHYSEELLNTERLRQDLAATLAADASKAKPVAERWALFLKSRAVALEFWSGIATTFVAIFGITSTVLTVIATGTKTPYPTDLLLLFISATMVFVAFKFRIDGRIYWLKFISAHLEAIAKLWPDPSIERSIQGQPHLDALHVKNQVA